jgi:pimeloyl-ACP methyl ester carboxylesterase
MRKLLLILFGVIFLQAFKISIKDQPVNPNVKIDSLYDLNINGCQQKILVQSNNTNNPVLLYLHGGPGSSFMLYSHIIAEKLKDNFIFVNWDNRGAALSYHEEMDTTKLSVDQIRDDALELTKYLLKTFHKKQIYLLGHSFGSVIGLQLVANNPEFFKAYIGVGQVINWDKSVAITYKWLHDTLSKANDTSGLRRIEADKFPYIDLIVKYGGHHRLSINLDSIIKASPYYFDGYLPLLKKGKEFSQYHVAKNPNPREASAKSISEINVPLYFFEGVNDHVIACAPELVVIFCKTVKAPKKEIVWFKNSAHYISVEEPVKFQDELIKILKEN